MSQLPLFPEKKQPEHDYALSIRQPWAWLIVQGIKTIENRPWSTRYRGKILIHAGKQLDKDGFSAARDLALLRFGVHIPEPEDYDLGGIVGEARISDVVTESKNPWFFGEYGFVLEEARPLPFRPLKGQLSFFKVERC